MGNEQSCGSPSDLESMKRYNGMSPGQVLLIKQRLRHIFLKREKFELMADEDLTIDKQGFMQLMKIKESDADNKIFGLFDLANDGRMDSHEFVCALALLSQANLKEKTDIIFSLYDFDHNRTITKNELVILTKTTLTALGIDDYIHHYQGAMSSKGECTIQEAEKKAESLLKRYDTSKDTTVSLMEFQSMVSKDPDILKMLYSYGIISIEDMRQDYGGNEFNNGEIMPEPDSDLESENNRKVLALDSKTERKLVGIDHKQGVIQEDIEIQQHQTYSKFQASQNSNKPQQWTHQIKNGNPSSWKPGKGDACPPVASLDLDYIYGFRCFDTRNNIKFTANGELVYFVAAAGIALDTAKNSQKFFLEHTDDITCIDVFENRIATGQVGSEPMICLWEVGSVSRATFKGVLKQGVGYLNFSNDGTKLVAVDMSTNHCIVVYDVDKALSGRGSGSKDDFLLASGHGPRSEVFDVKFDKVDKKIILACKNEVWFASYDNFSIRLEKGIWDSKICAISAVLCIGIVENNNVVTGTFKGQVLNWKGTRVIDSKQGHKGAVLSIHSRKAETGFITGGKDGTIVLWDSSMKVNKTIILSELNLKMFNLKVITVTENVAGTVIVIGTRGGDIVELNKNKILVRGHSDGHLRGLCVHSKLQQFYTIGEDHILALWQIKERKMLICIRLDYPSRAIHISQDSRFLAVGCINGTIIIIDPKTLIPTFNFKDRDAEVSCIKFSHNTEILAVGHAPPACEIILYSIKNHFKKTNVLRGSPSTIISIDFSMNCRILQVNDRSSQVLYYEVSEGSQKVQPNGSENYKEEKWSTYTAIYGWHVKGVWPDVSNGSDINSVDRSNRGDIVATADDFSSIKLFRFPAAIPKQGYLRYSGHAAHVSNVRFTADDEYLISLGGMDKSIFQWKFNFDRDTQLEIDMAQDQIPDQDIKKEYLSTSVNEQNDEEQKSEQTNKQYFGPVKASVPTSHKPDLKRDNQLPNGNLQLSYILGFKTQDPHQEALNQIKYNLQMKAIYPACSVVVVMDMKPDKNGQRPQTFFRQHKGDISSIALHPKKNLVATGGRSFGLKPELVPIHIWDTETKQIAASIHDFHLCCVYAMAFTPDGAYLVSVGGDEDYSLTVHDWSSNQLLCTAKTGRSPISAVVIRSQTDFIVCGLKSVKFYSIFGRNLKSQSGSLGGQFEPMTAAVIGFNSNECITGSSNGNLFLWKDAASQRPVKGHERKVTSLCSYKNQLYSAGLDGKVVLYSLTQGQLTIMNCVFDTAKLFKSPLIEQRPDTGGIISMDVQNDTILIGTVGAELYEVTLAAQPKPQQISQGHFGGELWGLACSPTQNKCVTCGGDSLLRIWDLDTKKQIYQLKQPLENDFRGIDWSSNGQMIVVGDVKGIIYLFDANNLFQLDKKPSKFSGKTIPNGMVWIQDIKFSPDCTRIAFGAHVKPSHLEIWEIEGDKLVRQNLITLGLQGALIHLDWATDNIHIVINSSAYEIKYVNIIKNKDVQGPSIKDLDWASWTCALGFPVQGIYPSKEEFEVTSVCASNSKAIIASGNYNGSIRIFRYPAACPSPQLHRELLAHSSKVTRIRFNHDDSMMVSISALDRCIMVWKTDFGKSQNIDQEQDERFEDDDASDLQLPSLKKKRLGGEKYGKLQKKEIQQKDQDDGLFDIDPAEKGEEYVLIKPWMGAIKEPSTYYKDPLNQNLEPRTEVAIDYVYGYRGRDCKNNVRYLKNGSIVYHAAALGIVLDMVKNTQRFFNRHDDDIICLDVHPDGIKVATGQLGLKPTIYVWDSNTLVPKCCFKGLFTKGICSLSFSPSGEKIAAVGLDDSHILAVYDTLTKSRTGGILIQQDLIGPEIVTDVKWKNDTEFVTVGINHLRQWVLSGGGLSSKKGILGKIGSTKYLTAVFNGEDCLVGASDGSIQLYKGHVYSNLFQLHEQGKSVDTLFINKDFLVSGGRDCKINLVETKGSYKVQVAIKLPDIVPKPFQLEIRSVSVSSDLKSLLVGTAGSEIYELSTKDAKINSTSKFTNPKSIMKAHYCQNKKSLNECWGLACNPIDLEIYYTCGDDGTLRAWSLLQRKQINMVKTNTDMTGNDMKSDDNGDLLDAVKGRSIGVSNDGVHVVVGFKDGSLRIYNKELKFISFHKCAKEWISDIKISPDNQSIAIGSHDNNIYIYNFPDMKQKNKPLKKHSSYITHLDFSQDGNYLHSNCGGYELLFWDITNGKQITQGSNTYRDEKWFTWTASLGWPVQGIWPELNDGSDINTVDRSHKTISGTDKPPDNYYLIATGDDYGQVKIYRYPCVKKQCSYILGKGHSSHITNVRFSYDDQFLITTGGDDNTIIQWKLQKRY